ncbi:MAG: TetR/AcrR family transcriptional regulator [Erysipelotrichaceae bacterium]|nr:TetR/AcrR family transcriptional regulator [Erysipelotrichaceae bacterium]
MPKVAYSKEERENIRSQLISIGLDLMARQGIQHTTVEQVYKSVGISRTFFYSFFSTKEDFIVEILYFQQPKIIQYVHELMKDTSLDWKSAVRKFLYSCCYGERNGIAILTIEEQQLLFNRLSSESYTTFREKQRLLFKEILEEFGIQSEKTNINLFINLSLALMVVRKAIPAQLPLFIPEAADETANFQIEALVNTLEKLKDKYPIDINKNK